jgi:octaprenyl-diphosphate synthase
MSVLSLDQIYQDVESDLKSVDKLIFDSLSARDKSINAIGQYVILAGGKRIRPLLNLVFAKIFNYQGDNNM